MSELFATLATQYRASSVGNVWPIGEMACNEVRSVASDAEVMRYGAHLLTRFNEVIEVRDPATFTRYQQWRDPDRSLFIPLPINTRPLCVYTLPKDSKAYQLEAVLRYESRERIGLLVQARVNKRRARTIGTLTALVSMSKNDKLVLPGRKSENLYAQQRQKISTEQQQFSAVLDEVADSSAKQE